MEHCHILMLGASCFGAGVAFAGGDDVCIVERGANIGAEYFDTYRACDGWKRGLDNAAARTLFRTMVDRRAINGDRSDAYVLAPFLYKMLEPCHARFRLWTEFLGMRADGDGFVVRLFDASGTREIHCDRVLDMTPQCVSAPAFDAANVRTVALTAVANAPNAAELMGAWKPASGTLRLGRTNDELFFTVPVDAGTGYADARQLLVAEWNRRREEFFRNNRIAFIAKRFDVTFAEDDKTFAPNHAFYNPARFENPLHAFDAGLTFGRNMK